MRTIPTCEPTELTAGDSWQWDRTLSEYLPTDGWALEYVLVGATPFPINVTNGRLTVSGSVYQVRVPAADTAGLAAGTYRIAAFATKGPDRFEVLRGSVTVLANLALLADGRTTTEKELALVDAAIAALLSSNVQTFQLNGRAVSKIDLAELKRTRAELRSQIYRQRNPGKLGPVMRIRFGRA